MKVAVVGLGKMGMQISEMLVAGGHTVGAFDEQPEQVQKAAAGGASALNDRQSAASFFGEQPCVVWLMIPSEFVDDELARWQKLLPKGSVVIDGGNSDFRLTMRRAEELDKSGLRFIDVGTSGGIHGRTRGFSLMAGGDGSAFKRVEPLLKTLAQPHGGYRYFGSAGSGHFVKMVHNAIEYGMMESLAEGYRLLNEGPYPNLDLAAVGTVWQSGSIVASDLNALVASALKVNPKLDNVDGYVAESGEARWALETAAEQKIELPAIQAAMDVRLASQKGKTSFATKLLAAMRNAFGGHAINKS